MQKVRQSVAWNPHGFSVLMLKIVAVSFFFFRLVTAARALFFSPQEVSRNIHRKKEVSVIILS